VLLPTGAAAAAGIVALPARLLGRCRCCHVCCLWPVRSSDCERAFSLEWRLPIFEPGANAELLRAASPGLGLRWVLLWPCELVSGMEPPSFAGPPLDCPDGCRRHGVLLVSNIIIRSETVSGAARGGGSIRFEAAAAPAVCSAAIATATEPPIWPGPEAATNGLRVCCTTSATAEAAAAASADAAPTMKPSGSKLPRPPWMPPSSDSSARQRNASEAGRAATGSETGRRPEPPLHGCDPRGEPSLLVDLAQLLLKDAFADAAAAALALLLMLLMFPPPMAAAVEVAIVVGPVKTHAALSMQGTVEIAASSAAASR